MGRLRLSSTSVVVEHSQGGTPSPLQPAFLHATPPLRLPQFRPGLGQRLRARARTLCPTHAPHSPHLHPHRVVGVRLKGVVWALELAKGAARRPGGGGRVRPARPDDGPPRRARGSGVCERQVDKKAVRSRMGEGRDGHSFFIFFVFLLDIVCSCWFSVNSGCPCASFRPLWAVRIGKGPSFLYFLEASDRMAKGRDGHIF